MSDASGLPASDVDRIIAHQEVCTSRLQEQISLLIVQQEHMHQQLFASHHDESHTWDHLVPQAHDLAPYQVEPHHGHDYNHLVPPGLAISSCEMAMEPGEIRQSGLSQRSKPELAGEVLQEVKQLLVPLGNSKPKPQKATTSHLMPRASAQSETTAKVRNSMSLHMKAFTQKQSIAAQGTIGIEDSYIVKAVRSVWFDPVCAVMLVSNSLFIAIQVEYAAQKQSLDVPIALVVIDYMYSIWFLIELILRIKVAGCAFFTDREEQVWNVFDCLIIGMSTFEMILAAIAIEGPLKNLSVLRMVRIARIARIARVIRLMRFFRHLRILLAAIFSTLKSCVWTAMLLGIILFMFGIVFVSATTEHRVEKNGPVSLELVQYYGTLPRGIFTTFKSVLGGLDWETAVQPLSDLHAIYVMLFVLMITFIYLAVINVISGLFLQSALETAQGDREDIIRQRLKEKETYVQKALELFGELDENLDGQVTLHEFEKHISNIRIVGFLKALDIDPGDAWTLFTLLDIDQGGTVSVDEFIEGCLTIRGNAKSLHIAQIMYENKWLMDAVQELTHYIEIQFKTLNEQFEMMQEQQQQQQNLLGLKTGRWMPHHAPSPSKPMTCTAVPPKGMPNITVAAPPATGSDNIVTEVFSVVSEHDAPQLPNMPNA